MAYYFSEPSRTFGEYLLVPGYSSSECVPTAVSLKTPLVKYRKGEETCPLEMNIPMVSAIMQSVSGEKLAIALAKQGGVSFIYGSQTIEQEADMVRRVKAYKKGFVTSDSNLPPEATLGDVLDLKTRTGHSTVAITHDGTAHGKLLGIVASRDYRLSRMTMDLKVTEFMTPLDKLVTAPDTTSLHDCNDIIWDNKINSLPLIDAEGHLQYMVFRKDYDSHKENVNELLDENKSYVVGAGINTRDFAQRVPALVDAGVDVLCIDSSEGFSEWQSRTIAWIRENYGDKVKVGAGNVVDREGFLFLAKAGADFIKIGIGGAVVRDGEVVMGSHGFAGEIGHLSVAMDGPLCSCGRHGCLEAFAGRRALVEAAGIAEDGDATSSEAIDMFLQRWRAGDSDVAKVVDQAADALVSAIASAVNLVDVDTVLLGGLWTHFGDELATVLEGRLRSEILGYPNVKIRVFVPPVALHPSLYGAAEMGLRRFIENPLGYMGEK